VAALTAPTFPVADAKMMDSATMITQTQLKTMATPPYICTICSQFRGYSEKIGKNKGKNRKKTFDTIQNIIYNDDIKNQAFVFRWRTLMAGFNFLEERRGC
jgi:hypothetical protein